MTGEEQRTMSLVSRIPLDAIQPVTPFASSCLHSPLVQYHWTCPSCGAHVVSYWTEGATPDQIAAEARCWYCRRARPEPRGGVCGLPRATEEHDDDHAC